MRKSSFLLWLVWLAAGCQTQRTDTEIITNNSPAKTISPPFSVMDSLDKYADTDSILLGDERLGLFLFIGKINECNFSVLAKPNNEIVFFQRRASTQWIATDTVQDSPCCSFVRCLDLNGDGSKDVAIACISAANTTNKVFLFDNASKSFAHNKHYDLVNVDYDEKQRFVRSSWFAGIVHCQEKQKYKIVGDSLAFDLGISYCPNLETGNKIATVKFYKKIGNSKVTTKETSGEANKLWRLFQKSLWDTENSY
jgi:hypothetical protein